MDLAFVSPMLSNATTWSHLGHAAGPTRLTAGPRPLVTAHCSTSTGESTLVIVAVSTTIIAALVVVTEGKLP